MPHDAGIVTTISLAFAAALLAGLLGARLHITIKPGKPLQQGSWGGPMAAQWQGVSSILSRAGVGAVPEARRAVFVGTEFDSLVGRGGADGTPLRRTPWGEIAWQLGDAEAFAAVAEHDAQGVAPGGEQIRAFLPAGPALILTDELMNYVSRTRKSGLATQLIQLPAEPGRGGAGTQRPGAGRLHPRLRAGDESRGRARLPGDQEAAGPHR